MENNMTWPNDFFIFLRRKANTLREDAGYNGEQTDGGASALIQQVEIYEAAMSKTIPDCWRKDYADFVKQIDPEYTKYLELKKKFES